MLMANAVSTFANEPVLFISSFAGGEKGGVNAYQLDTKTGALKLLHENKGIENPFFLAHSPDRRFLYSIDTKSFGGKEHDQIAAIELVGRSGQLKPLNKQSAKGNAACYLAVDATGSTLLVANYSSGSVASLPVNKDGTLADSASFFEHSGPVFDPKRQKGPHAHSIIVSPNNKFVYAADLGLDQVLCYKLDAGTAKLTKNDPPFAKTADRAGPRHLTFDPAGKRLYAINEISNTVTAFNYNSGTGALTELQTITTLPSDFTATTNTADLKFTPDGKFLYGTNRGHDSIAMYRVADDGKLTLLGNEPSLGKGPQNLAISPGGEWLICANMPGNNVAVFRIDSQTGSLKSAGEPIKQTMPSCIMLIP